MKYRKEDYKYKEEIAYYLSYKSYNLMHYLDIVYTKLTRNGAHNTNLYFFNINYKT